ncbi:MAG: hypothetical protein M5U09_12700 [Gammaproteobacteria bacterium]|nr:hypothetical protein [Gammaproteobacteria bacterium]
MDENRPDKQTDSGPLERHVELDSGTEYAAVPLAQGAQVDNFLISRTICDSFSGFTYAAMDADNRRPFIIQEYFPEEVSVRDLDRVSLLLRDETVSNEFEFGLTRFYRLTAALSRYEGKGRVTGVFEQNDTAYYATPFDFRCTLNDVLASGKRVPAANVESWLKGCLRFPGRAAPGRTFCTSAFRRIRSSSTARGTPYSSASTASGRPSTSSRTSRSTCTCPSSASARRRRCCRLPTCTPWRRSSSTA